MPSHTIGRDAPRSRTPRGAALLASLFCLPAAAQDPAVPLFAEDAPMAVRIEAPLTTLTRERSDTEELDGHLYYTDTNGAEQALDLQIRARGRYRRKEETCSFPPLRLDFDKKQVDATPFAGVNRLKLVTHCKDSNPYEQNVLEEYLAYRILNGLTDRSFRARLLHVDYLDSERGRTDRRYAFLIEDDDLLEDRIGAARFEPQSLSYELLQPEQAALVSVFQYLIGNTDFSMVAGPADDTCCHNVQLFGSGPDGYLPIPYDFDFSGLVNARYAEPNPRLNIRRVTSRLYRGSCLHNAHVADAASAIIAKRAQVMALVDTVPGMDDKTRKTARDYLARFFDEMSRPDAVEKRFIRECS